MHVSRAVMAVGQEYTQQVVRDDRSTSVIGGGRLKFWRFEILHEVAYMQIGAERDKARR